jgi:hypothetical protein
MSTTEFPAAGPAAGINSQIEFYRSKPVMFRNSKFLCWVTMSGSFFAVLLGIGALLVIFSMVFPISDLTADRGWSALRWAFTLLAMICMVPWLWKLGRNMAGYQVRLDNRGVDFNLGTKKKPSDLFMPWEQISAIKQRRSGNVQQFVVYGTDGSTATFTSYTFFRPKKLARLIAARTGVAITKL